MFVLLPVSAGGEWTPQCRSGPPVRRDAEHAGVPLHHVQSFTSNRRTRKFHLKPESMEQKSTHHKSLSNLLLSFKLLQFIIAGLVSNLLFKYPALLTVSWTKHQPACVKMITRQITRRFVSQVSFAVNCGCIIMAVIGAALISVDLADWTQENEEPLRVSRFDLKI